MSTLGEHTHHIKIRSTQMEMAASGASENEEDYVRRLKENQQQIERVQAEREDIARKKTELEEFTSRKRNFLSQQAELSEKLTSALTLIDRTLFEIKQENEDLEQCRTCFAAHLERIQKINPEAWNRDTQPERLEKASMAIDIASDEYDQAASHFEGSRSGGIFGRRSKRSRSSHRDRTSSEFMVNLSNGFAFNLPIIVLGSFAIFIYLVR